MMPCPLPVFSQSDYVIQVVYIKSHILNDKLLKKPTDLDLHCLQSGFSRTRVYLIGALVHTAYGSAGEQCDDWVQETPVSKDYFPKICWKRPVFNGIEYSNKVKHRKKNTPIKKYHSSKSLLSTQKHWYFLSQNKICRYSLELSHSSNSNEYHILCFLLEK